MALVRNGRERGITRPPVAAASRARAWLILRSAERTGFAPKQKRPELAFRALDSFANLSVVDLRSGA